MSPINVFYQCLRSMSYINMDYDTVAIDSRFSNTTKLDIN